MLDQPWRTKWLLETVFVRFHQQLLAFLLKFLPRQCKIVLVLIVLGVLKKFLAKIFTVVLASNVAS